MHDRRADFRRAFNAKDWPIYRRDPQMVWSDRSPRDLCPSVTQFSAGCGLMVEEQRERALLQQGSGHGAEE